VQLGRANQLLIELRISLDYRLMGETVQDLANTHTHTLDPQESGQFSIYNQVETET